MAGEKENIAWPLPKFAFSVTIDGAACAFQEVSGLDTQAQTIAYRSGESTAFSTIKMPGIKQTGNVTLKKGLLSKDTALLAWFNQSTMNVVKRQTLVIALLDQAGRPTMTWTLANAWPTKITGTDLKSDGNEVAVESIEVAYETLIISAP